jgi:uncharacterized membrane protein
MSEAKKLSQEDKVWAAIGYLWILSIIALSARKSNDFIRFHASQGSLLFVLSIAFMFIPVLGWALNVLLVVAVVVGIVKAWQGEKWELPVLGTAAKSFGDWLIKTLKL